MSREIGLFPPPYLISLLNGFVQSPVLSKDYANAFFLSFEDALTSIMQTRAFSPNDTFLYPDFFCMDVVNLLERAGLRGIPYQLTDTLDVDDEDFKGKVTRKNPALIFIYHPLGKQSALMNDSSWITTLNERCIIIEDCADTLLSGQKPNFIHTNHIIIDSTRKLTPFQGARVYHSERCEVGEPKSLSFSLTAMYQLVNLLNFITYLFPLRRLLEWKWALFGAHSNATGRSFTPLCGNTIERIMLRSFNVNRIKSARALHVKLYYELLTDAARRRDITLMTVRQEEYGELRFFPLICKKGVGTKIADALEAYGIYVDTHFDDSPFCEIRDCLLLPLWPTLSEDTIRLMCRAVIACL